MKEKDSADISMEQLILERKRRMKMWNEKSLTSFASGTILSPLFLSLLLLSSSNSCSETTATQEQTNTIIVSISD